MQLPRIVGFSRKKSQREKCKHGHLLHCEPSQPLGQISFPSGIFAGTKITAEALVQTLRFEEPPDAPPPARTGKTFPVNITNSMSPQQWVKGHNRIEEVFPFPRLS